MRWPSFEWQFVRPRRDDFNALVFCIAYTDDGLVLGFALLGLGVGLHVRGRK